jgi:hypothetical protein
MEAYEKEILIATTKGYTKYDLWESAKISKNAIIKKLDANEQKRFIKEFDQKYDRLITTTSPAGAEEVKKMIKEGVMTIEKGKIIDVDLPPTSDNKVDVLIEGKGAKKFDYVISGLGQQKLDRTKFPMIRALISKGIAQINETGKGIVVDNRMEASPGLIIVGPLLTGIKISPANLELSANNGDYQKVKEKGLSSRAEIHTGLHNLAEGRSFIKAAVTTITCHLLGKKLDNNIFVSDPTSNLPTGVGKLSK